MSSRCFIMNVVSPSATNVNDSKRVASKEKIIAYEEKTVGSTPFFKCEACPYMALAVDDIKFHLFTVHPELSKENGLADNIKIPCPGCSCVFDVEETLRNHLRNHHKMGFKDVKKMIKSLVQIALKDAKLKKEDEIVEPPMSTEIRNEAADVKIPQLIEIVPDAKANSEILPKGVTFISFDELQKMSTPNFEKLDPKELIQEASINIVYTNEVPSQYVNVNNLQGSNSSCNVIQVSNVTPDLISSVQQQAPINVENNNLVHQTSTDNTNQTYFQNTSEQKAINHSGNSARDEEKSTEEKSEKKCTFKGCHTRLKDEEKLKYHKTCHQNKSFQCPECGLSYPRVEKIHNHLWKSHGIDLELPTCDICGYKTFLKHRLYHIHMKCHGKIRLFKCSICLKSFKNMNQLSKHKLIHRKVSSCPICLLEFNSEARLKLHTARVHEKLKPFKCSECEYSAARKEELRLHTRSHTGDKPYSCEQCEYKSADHNAMRRHKKIHSKNNLYMCKHCPYTSVQSTSFASHMISKHPSLSSEIYRCPYCRFKSVNKDKYIVHLTTHTDKEGIQLLIKMTKEKLNKPSWTIPSETEKLKNDEPQITEQNNHSSSKSVKTIPIEVYDCDSISENIPQDYSKPYNNTDEDKEVSFTNQVTDLSKDDNNSDCAISENSNDVILANSQFTPQHALQDIGYDNSKSLQNFLNNVTTSSIQSTTANSSPLTQNGNINSNIMNNFPIRLPPSSQSPIQNNITLMPVDKIPLPVPKLMGPIIKPTQILPVPSSSNSPVNIISPNEVEGAPRKKPKISVKSNLILKGPDQINMFHSQQKMAFKRLEDNERFCLGNPVTFNNLITTQFMQLQSETTLSESPSNIMAFSQEKMMVEAVSTSGDADISDDQQMFTFNQQRNVNMVLPASQKNQTSDPSYVKLEATIKQNTQSPSLERMCNASILNNQEVTREYKASPPLEDIHKNIKNEVKSDAFYNLALNNTATNHAITDQYLMDNIIEQYGGHMDLAAFTEIPNNQENDVIEIDDNSDDTKLLPRFDLNNFPLESLYLMHNDFHFLETDIQTNTISNDGTLNDMNRIMADVPILNQNGIPNIGLDESSNGDNNNLIQGNKDPIMNNSVRSVNKINVKNIELMKN